MSMGDEEPAAAIEVTRDAIMKEYQDGTIAIRILVAARDFPAFLKAFPQTGLPGFLVREEPESAQRRLQNRVIAQEDPVPKESKGPYGAAARTLRLCIDFMGNPKVWAALGTDDDFLEWCKLQKCVVCGLVPHYEGETYIFSEPAHVRRIAEGAGVAIKPPFCAVPMCHKDHAKQHQHGESAVGGKEFLDQKRVQAVQAWLWEQCRMLAGVESMAMADPAEFRRIMVMLKVDQYLPAGYG